MGVPISLEIANHDRVIIVQCENKRKFIGIQIHVIAQPLDNVCCIRLSTRLRLNRARGNDNLFWSSKICFKKLFRLFMMIS